MTGTIGALSIASYYDHTGNAAGERYLHVSGGFTNYAWTPSSTIYIHTATPLGATGIDRGLYTIASKVDNDGVLLAETRVFTRMLRMSAVEWMVNPSCLIISTAGACLPALWRSRETMVRHY